MKPQRPTKLTKEKKSTKISATKRTMNKLKPKIISINSLPNNNLMPNPNSSRVRSKFCTQKNSKEKDQSARINTSINCYSNNLNKKKKINIKKEISTFSMNNMIIHMLNGEKRQSVQDTYKFENTSDKLNKSNNMINKENIKQYFRENSKNLMSNKTQNEIINSSKYHKNKNLISNNGSMKNINKMHPNKTKNNIDIKFIHNPIIKNYFCMGDKVKVFNTANNSYEKYEKIDNSKILTNKQLEKNSIKSNEPKVRINNNIEFNNFKKNKKFPQTSTNSRKNSPNKLISKIMSLKNNKYSNIKNYSKEYEKLNPNKKNFPKNQTNREKYNIKNYNPKNNYIPQCKKLITSNGDNMNITSKDQLKNTYKLFFSNTSTNINSSQILINANSNNNISNMDSVKSVTYLINQNNKFDLSSNKYNNNKKFVDLRIITGLNSCFLRECNSNIISKNNTAKNSPISEKKNESIKVNKADRIFKNIKNKFSGNSINDSNNKEKINSKKVSSLHKIINNKGVLKNEKKIASCNNNSPKRLKLKKILSTDMFLVPKASPRELMISNEKYFGSGLLKEEVSPYNKTEINSSNIRNKKIKTINKLKKKQFTDLTFSSFRILKEKSKRTNCSHNNNSMGINKEKQFIDFMKNRIIKNALEDEKKDMSSNKKNNFSSINNCDEINLIKNKITKNSLHKKLIIPKIKNINNGNCTQKNSLTKLSKHYILNRGSSDIALSKDKSTKKKKAKTASNTGNNSKINRKKTKKKIIQKINHTKKKNNKDIKLDKLLLKNFIDNSDKKINNSDNNIPKTSKNDISQGNIIINTDVSNNSKPAKKSNHNRNVEQNTLFNDGTNSSLLTTMKDSNYYSHESENLSKYIKEYYASHNKYPPTDISFYKYGRIIGRGAFGKVNIGLNILTGRIVAVKSFNKKNILTENSKRKILYETNLMRNLYHPSVTKILETFESEQYILIIMEYISGGNLQDFVKKRRKLSEKTAKILFRQIIQGIKYIHSKGIVHRDIKLENILLDLNNIIKICDFGVGKLIKPGQKLKEQCGTPVYMAPEIIKGEEYEGFPVDIWSAGVALYIMLSGNIPFNRDNNHDLQSAIVNLSFKKIEKISNDANDLLEKILEKNPEKRLNAIQILSHPWMNDHINTNEDYEYDLEIKNVNKYHLFTNAESILLAKTHIDYRKAPKQDLAENFTIKNLYTIEDKMNNKNIETKSFILTPYNSMLTDEEEEDEEEEDEEDKIEIDFEHFNKKKKHKKDKESIDTQTRAINYYYRSTNPYDILDNFDSDLEIKNNFIKFHGKVKECNKNYELNNNGEIDNGMLINTKGTILPSVDEKEDEEKEKEKKSVNKKEVVKTNNYSYNYKKSIINKECLKIVSDLGYKEDYVIKSLENNELNHATAIYYLFSNYENIK